MAGLQNLTFSVPKEWDPVWFQRFVRDHLSKADVRNAIGTPGVTVTGDTTTVATISYGVDALSQQLANAVFAPPMQAAATIESQAINFSQFPRPDPTAVPIADTQNVRANKIFSSHV